MRRRAPATTVELLGGGPADGSRRAIDDDATVVDVAEPRGLDGGPPGAVVHRYERGPDGRFRYAGAFDVSATTDGGSAEPASRVGPGEDGGTRAPVVVSVVLLLTTLLYAFSEYA